MYLNYDTNTRFYQIIVALDKKPKLGYNIKDKKTNMKKNLGSYKKNYTKNYEDSNKLLGNIKKLFKKEPSKRLISFVEPEIQNSPLEKVFQTGGVIVGLILKVTIIPIFYLIFGIFKSIPGLKLGGRLMVIQILIFVLFGAIVLKLAQLQLYGIGLVAPTAKIQVLSKNLATPARGNIFIQDGINNRDDVIVAMNKAKQSLYADIFIIKQEIDKKVYTLDELALALAINSNISLTQIRTSLLAELQKPTPSRYFLLSEELTQEQKEKIEAIRESKDKAMLKFNFANWLQIQESQERYYPYKESMSSILGFSSKPTGRNDARQKCPQFVENNEEGRNLYPQEYVLGSYGIEQQYCGELGGLYGKKLTPKELLDSNLKAKLGSQDGADIYLTIDKNLQKKAEEILKRAVEANTNGNKVNGKGGPLDATMIVMETETGKIVAMANYPSDDANSNNKNWEGFASVAGKPYEPGSVMKAITVATALQMFQDGVKDPVNGNRLGVTPNFSFVDYDKEGKKYQENNGVIKSIKNADQKSFASLGGIGLREILVFSINTGISELTDKMGMNSKVGGVKMEEYWKTKFLLDSRPVATFSSDGNSNFKSLSESLYCPICFANYGYGQGISVTPLQLMRAYSPFANNGKLLEPYLVEKIKYQNGEITTRENDKRYKETKQILSPETAQNVTNYLIATVDQKNKNGKSPAQVPKYSVAGKSGTSQIARKTFDNKPCSYGCNQEKGLYDHTYIGYGPASKPKYMTLIKMAEPNPGELKNYASITLTPFFKEMMQFAFEYKNIAPDR